MCVGKTNYLLNTPIDHGPREVSPLSLIEEANHVVIPAGQ